MSQIHQKVIPHNKPTIGKEEELAAIRVIKSGWLAQGKEVQLFENEFCEFLGLPRGHAVAVSSGTAALYLSLWAIGSKGKKVAFPAFVCSALRNATLMAGGKEILIDSNPDHPNINLDNIVQSQAEISIIPHLYGNPQDFSKIKKEMLVIEDAAQTIGATMSSIPVGLHGDIGIFSFYATKMMTSGGQGGMVVSNNKYLIEKIKDYRHFDEIRDKNLRFNLQMTDIEAAIGRVQLRKLPQLIKRREEIYQKYKQAGIPLLDVRGSDVNSVRYRAIMVTDKQYEVIAALDKENIRAVIPVRREEISIQSNQLPQALAWTGKTVSLPIYPTLEDDSVEKIISIVLDIESK